ncbi:MAG: toxin [bacterium]
MKYFTWGNAKNETLINTRGISFEEIVFHIEKGDLLDILEHQNQKKYKGQRILVVNVEGYVYLVPFLEMENEVILKTIIPSRKATKKYLRGESNDG